jgi:hypothetical protein
VRHASEWSKSSATFARAEKSEKMYVPGRGFTSIAGKLRAGDCVAGFGVPMRRNPLLCDSVSACLCWKWEEADSTNWGKMTLAAHHRSRRTRNYYETLFLTLARSRARTAAVRKTQNIAGRNARLFHFRCKRRPLWRRATHRFKQGGEQAGVDLDEYTIP